MKDTPRTAAGSRFLIPPAPRAPPPVPDELDPAEYPDSPDAVTDAQLGAQQLPPDLRARFHQWMNARPQPNPRLEGAGTASNSN